jgi:hypothetical protein
VKLYTIRQLDQQGGVVSEKRVEADHTDGALRQLTGITDATVRIEVYDADQEKVGETLADFWRRKVQRTRGRKRT